MQDKINIDKVKIEIEKIAKINDLMERTQKTIELFKEEIEKNEPSKKIQNYLFKNLVKSVEEACEKYNS